MSKYSLKTAALKQSIFLKSTISQEVITLIMQVQPKFFMCFDDIPTIIIKKVTNLIAVFFSAIVNEVLLT